MKVLLSGNEAIARGAYEYGVKVATGYPGTPSSEILENVAKYSEIYSEWSVNEKVAMDVAMDVTIGAAYAGQRTMVTMHSPRRVHQSATGNPRSNLLCPLAL